MRIIAILSLFLLLGCANKVHVSSGDGIVHPAHLTISVSCSGDDALSIRQKLEHLLTSKGFIVVPERTARIRAKMQNGRETPAELDEKGKPPESPKGPGSIYILQFSYEYSAAVSYGDYMFEAFSATVLDLKNGNVVASADYSQGSFGSRSVSSIMEEFVNKLTNSI